MIEIAQTLKQTENRPDYLESLDTLIQFFQMDRWKKQVANAIIYRWNKEDSDLDATVYESSDSFFLLQCGGYVEPIREWIYQKGLFDSKCSIKLTPNVNTLFLQICKEINDFTLKNSHFSNQVNTKILAATWTHVFNLTPHKFKKYWSDPTLVNKALIEPGQRLWNHCPSDQEKNSILQMISDKEVFLKRILSLLSKEEVSLRHFRKEVMQYLDPSTHHQFTVSIEAFMQKIDINSFLRDMKTLLANLNITVNTKGESHLIAYLKRKVVKGEGAPLLNPQQLAKFMHRALMLMPKKAIFIPQYLLEEEICNFYALPQRIELGSLNWVTHLVEKHDEDKLILKYDVDSDDVTFFLKRETSIKILPKSFTNDLLKEIYFFLPD